MSIVNNQSGWGVIQRDICIQRMRFRCLDELKAWNGRLVYGSFISALTHIVHALACMTLPLHGLLFMLFIPMHDASMCVHVCLSVHRSTRLFSSVLHFFGLGHRWACVYGCACCDRWMCWRGRDSRSARGGTPMRHYPPRWMNAPQIDTINSRIVEAITKTILIISPRGARPAMQSEGIKSARPDPPEKSNNSTPTIYTGWCRKL